MYKKQIKNHYLVKIWLYIKNISVQSAKSISENREKLNGLLLSSKNTKFEFRSLLELKSVLDELENRL